MNKSAGFVILLLAFWTVASPAFAEDLCEVMTLNGTATVTSGGVSRPMVQGDLLKVGDRVQVAAGSTADIAFDKGWNNVTRIGGSSDVTIKSIFPTGLSMTRGDLFSELKKLPKNSTFEIQTPSSVAAVRGSAYRTTHDEAAGTHVYNFSPSRVEVYGVDPEGNIQGEPVVLENTEKTEIDVPGEEPKEPEPMTEEEKQQGFEMQGGVQEEVKEAIDEGREASLPDIDEINKSYQEGLADRLDEMAPPLDETASESDASKSESDETASEPDGTESETTEETAPEMDGSAGSDTGADFERMDQIQDPNQQDGDMLPDFDRMLDSSEQTLEQIDQESERKEDKIDDGGTGDGGGEDTSAGTGKYLTGS